MRCEVDLPEPRKPEPPALSILGETRRDRHLSLLPGASVCAWRNFPAPDVTSTLISCSRFSSPCRVPSSLRRFPLRAWSPSQTAPLHMPYGDCASRAGDRTRREIFLVNGCGSAHASSIYPPIRGAFSQGESGAPGPDLRRTRCPSAGAHKSGVSLRHASWRRSASAAKWPPPTVPPGSMLPGTLVAETGDSGGKGPSPMPLDVAS